MKKRNRMVKQNININQWVSQKVVNNWTRAVLGLLGLLFIPMNIVLRRGVEYIEIALSCVTHFKYTR